MKVFEPFKIRELTIKNRFVMAPMCMYNAPTSGVVQPFHIHHYATRAYGGVGLIIVEATGVEPRGRITDHDLGIWSDEHVEGLHRIVDAVHEGGAHVAIQLAHAGRKSQAQDQPVAPSDMAYSTDYRVPQALSTVEVYETVHNFVQAAKRAIKAGFDGLEIHGAHGYLINQFISPLTNHRTDEFGGSLEKRVHFLKLILEGIREFWKGPLWVRLSADEYAPEGHHIQETLHVIHQIRHLIDAVDVSSGGVVSYPIQSGPLYQMPLSKVIKQSGIVTIGGGIVTQPDEIDAIFDNEEADAVFLARELLRNPYFPLHYAKSRGLLQYIPAAYERGFK